MQVSLTDAKAKLTDLVRRAEAGDEVILTRHGQPAVRLVPVAAKPTRAQKRALLEAFRGRAKGKPGFEAVDAAHGADFLYDERGLPG
jgi:prevent-host-death family protein